MPPDPIRRSARELRDLARSTPAIRCDCGAVLNAAEEVILRDGIGKLTLEAVARQASLSKSGLLHHFPSKEALVDALVQRKVQEWIDDTAEAYEAAPPGRGRSVRAILGTCLSSTEHWTDAMRRSSMVLVAALVHDPKHAEHLRKANSLMHERFGKDGLPAGVGDLAHLAVHGIWFDWIFGLSDWSPQRLNAVRLAIQRLLASDRGGSKPKTGSARTDRSAKQSTSPRLGRKSGNGPIRESSKPSSKRSRASSK